MNTQKRDFLLGTTLALVLSGCSRGIASQAVIKNPLGLAFAPQPVEVPLSAPARKNAPVLDEAGNVVGQVTADGQRALLRVGVDPTQAHRVFRVGAEGQGKALSHPVRLERKVWPPAGQAKPVKFAADNGVAEYFELTNDLCGVRIPAAVRVGVLPGTRVPAPIVGVQFPDGEWAGRPDFRSLIPPLDERGHRVNWQFSSFQAKVVEQGPAQSTVRLSISTNERKEPFQYEVTLYADEKFVKFHQLSGRINDWLLDFNLSKKTPWRPTRSRSGAQHHWGEDGAGAFSDVTLPDHVGQKYFLKWDKGPGPAAGKELRGEGESDLLGRKAWIEPQLAPGDGWGKVRLLHKSGDSDDSHSKWGLATRGVPFWYPWAGVGSEVYALDPKGGANAPVGGLIVGPAGDVSGWEFNDNPGGDAGLFQHIPVWLDSDNPGALAPYALAYLADPLYTDLTGRDQPIIGIKFGMHAWSGSYFIWLGKNADILPDINDPKYTLDYRSPLWQDYSRFTSGVANLQDAIRWNADWPDPKSSGASIEPERLAHNIELARKGTFMGDTGPVNLWRLRSDAQRLAAVDAYISQMTKDARERVTNAQSTHWGIDPGHFQWYTFDRDVSLHLDELNAYLALGRKASGGLLSNEQWNALKAIGAFRFEQAFDEDRALLWNANTNMNHGGGTMTSMGITAREAIILGNPSWPESQRFAARPVAESHAALKDQIGRWGAQFTSTHYSSGAAITALLGDLVRLQWLSYRQPDKFRDEYRDDARLRHYAFFLLNRTGVADPRYGNIRVPIEVGNGSSGWGHPAAAMLASGFRNLDPQLSKWMMWAWDVNGRSHRGNVIMPLLTDYSLPAEPYPFPAISSFPGNMTIHRSAQGTSNETAAFIVDGSFFRQHRDASEDGEVHIDALGKPLVTNDVSYTSPGIPNELYVNTLGMATAGWNSDSYWSGEKRAAWNNARVSAIGSYQTGSYSRSEYSATAQGPAGGTWRRDIALIHADDDAPIIAVRDRVSQPGDYVVTWWLQTEGAVSLPGGKTVMPPLKAAWQPGTGGIVNPTPEQSPSAVKLPGVLAPGPATFGFTGHDWLKLFPKSYARAGRANPNIGALVDTDVHALNAAPFEAVIGQWRKADSAAQFRIDAQESFDDRQYLRVKFHGTEHLTIFTPFHRGQRPADLKVGGTPNAATVSYTSSGGVKQRIVITPTGYIITSNGKPAADEKFPTQMPAKLYPQWNDVAYKPQAG